MKITSYYIDDDHVLHTFIGNMEHVFITDVYSDEEAENIIEDLNENES